LENGTGGLEVGRGWNEAPLEQPLLGSGDFDLPRLLDDAFEASVLGNHRIQRRGTFAWCVGLSGWRVCLHHGGG